MASAQAGAVVEPACGDRRGRVETVSTSRRKAGSTLGNAHSGHSEIINIRYPLRGERLELQALVRVKVAVADSGHARGAWHSFRPIGTEIGWT